MIIHEYKNNSRDTNKVNSKRFQTYRLEAANKPVKYWHTVVEKLRRYDTYYNLNSPAHLAWSTTASKRCYKGVKDKLYRTMHQRSFAATMF
eukprot:scaffold69390_cov18-Prasinocladus_malaysianus.AAC.1